MSRASAPGRLRFVERAETYSVYVDADGERVILSNEPFAAWTWSPAVGNRRTVLVRRGVRRIALETCESCEAVDVHPDLSRCINGGNTLVCQSCIDEYYSWCDSCEEYVSSDETTWTLDETLACDRCLSDNYSYCEECDGYSSQGCREAHDDNCGCESPAQQFTIRNDGEAPLANDTRCTVTLPAGTIDSVGIGAIARYLRECSETLRGGQVWNNDRLEWDWHGSDPETGHKLHSLSFQLAALGEKWQTKEGNYTKRLSRFAYKTFGLKVTPDILSRIGCIARDHSTAVDFHIEVTRDLNQSAEAFYHESSCWWSDYSESRCALKSNGGFGLRTFDADGIVSGRAWVLPLKLDDRDRLAPTFDTTGADAFVVINGYGDLEGYAPARILAHTSGLTYRKIAFDASPMYVNNTTGYLVASETLADIYTDGALSLDLDQHARIYDRELANA